jgi:hypothetical protein
MAAHGFAEVMITPEPGQMPSAPLSAMEIEFGGGIRVRIPSTTPIGLASAVVKALATR